MTRSTLRLARFARADRGTAKVEFCILFPVFIVLLLSGFEAGMLMTRQLMLERGLDLTMRELRLGTMANPTHTAVKQEICEKSLIIPNCMTSVQLELREVDMVAWNVPMDGNRCVDRTAELDPMLDPPDGFTAGARNVLMMVRACAVFDPWFPGVGLGTQLPRDRSGGYRLVATSGFVNEP
jgi:hypothetical protein